MRLTRYMMTIASAAMLCSCEKEIDFEYHDIEPQTVIEGLLTADKASVRLTETVATDEPFADNAIDGATVTITDLSDGRVVTLQPDGDGRYADARFGGVPGHEYELRVESRGHVYTAESRMLKPLEILSAEFNWIAMPYDDVAVLKVQFTVDDDPHTRYWMRVYRNGEVYAWQAITSHNAVDGVATGMMMTTRRDTDEEDDDDVLLDGDTVGIEILPVSQEMGDYLDSLNNGDYNGNIMFGGAYCLGYFLAAPVSATELTFHPDGIPMAE